MNEVSDIAIVYHYPDKCRILDGESLELEALPDWCFRVYHLSPEIIPNARTFLETYAGNLNLFEEKIHMTPPSGEVDYFPTEKEVLNYISRR